MEDKRFPSKFNFIYLAFRSCCMAILIKVVPDKTKGQNQARKVRWE